MTTNLQSHSMMSTMPKPKWRTIASEMEEDGSIENHDCPSRIHCQTINDYDFSFLKSQFLPSMGRTWITRREAAQSLARWLGFRRTGSSIEKAVRSVINGLLRVGIIEKDGAEWIRKA